MTQRYNPVASKVGHMLHGGDYNPDQWLYDKSIWDEDIRLMKLAHVNCVSVGIFSWVSLEPAEGVYRFEWLDEIIDKLWKNGISVILATPTGARPAWMAQAHPEVLRVTRDLRKNHFGERHNHCYTSPYYREKAAQMDTLLAERYKDHPAVIAWHISNEYGGECYCELCQAAFRDWLKEKYGGDLDRLNHEWWTAFWSHTYTDWSQIEAPGPLGENGVHGLTLDWKRFVTHQTVDFMKNEIAAVKAVTPDRPVTANLMGTYEPLDYWKLARELDIVSWDSYPFWHSQKEEWRTAADTGYLHDLTRSLGGGKPFLLMESTPSVTNWQPVSKQKRPGMHLLSSLQAVAHGSDSVLYFQWRKGRGSSEKFHGAVVDHAGHEHTRVFRDVAGVGEALTKLDDVLATSVRADVAIVYDWENRWALDAMCGVRNCMKDYEAFNKVNYYPFWQAGVPVDLIESDGDYSKYKIVIAPCLYMLKPGVAEKITAFVEAGGTFVATYMTGEVNENDLCFLGGFPGPLRKVLGIWAEELDGLYDEDEVAVRCGLGGRMKPEYTAKYICEVIHSEGARVLASYGSDYYAGLPAVTENRYGKGKAYYVAFRSDDFLMDFYRTLIDAEQPLRAVPFELPLGVSATVRFDGEQRYVFLMNFTAQPQAVTLDRAYVNLLDGRTVSGQAELPGYGVLVLA